MQRKKSEGRVALLLATVTIVGLLISILLSCVSTARTLPNGYAWDIGGIRTQPTPEIFLCAGTYTPNTGTYTPNPLAALLPELVVDC